MDTPEFDNNFDNNKAAALSYSGTGAPIIVASGSGALAAQITQVADANGVPLLQDSQLTELLCQLPVGDEIPEFLYLAVAEILAYVFRMNEAFETHV